MHTGIFVFAQIVQFLPQRQFRRVLAKYSDRTTGWSMSHWNHLLVLMFGQLIGCGSLRELTDITTAHAKKSKHLGFGHHSINRQMLSKANALRDHRVFEEFAFHMVSVAQSQGITKEFELHGKFYAIDSTTIDLCMSVFRWAEFKSTKSGIRIHTQIDIVTEIPVFYRITNAKVHDVNSMDWFSYEPLACYVFDRGYFDLARLFTVNLIGSNFVIRQRGHLQYEIVEGEDLLEGPDNILFDQTIRLTGQQTVKKYPSLLRRIVYYSTEHNRSFTYLTNSFEVKAEHIALLYKNRWQVELFFRWIKQHLHVKSFWGITENAVRIQIFSAITAYCLVAIIEHDLHLNRSTFDVLRILSMSLLDKTPIRELFERTETVEDMTDIGQAQLCFNF